MLQSLGFNRAARSDARGGGRTLGETMRYKTIAILVISAFLMACAKNNIECARGKTLSLYPAVYGNEGDKDCHDYYGDCVLFQTSSPVLQLSDIKFQALPHKDANNQIAIMLDHKESLGLQEVSEQYGAQGKLLAIVYEGEVLHAPKLRGKITTDKVTIDFCNPQLYKIVLAVLRGQMPPTYNFNADPAVRTCLGQPKK
jgi:hypothetical protein